jgi:hypothetical protein
MKLVETCAMCVTLLLGISSFASEKELALVVKLLFTRSCCCGSSSDAHDRAKNGQTQPVATEGHVRLSRRRRGQARITLQ